MALRPPKRLCLLLEDGCDFCPWGRCTVCPPRGLNLYRVGPPENFWGWQYCHCLPCQQKVRDSRSKYIQDPAEITRQIGSGFRVQRSSGDVDYDQWQVLYCMFQEETKGFQVTLRHRHQPLQKSVSLAELLEWNKGQ